MPLEELCIKVCCTITGTESTNTNTKHIHETSHLKKGAVRHPTMYEPSKGLLLTHRILVFNY